MKITKVEVARHQLGTALDLFMRDQDPISVHVLACSGGEIADHLSDVATKEPFSLDILRSNPDRTMSDLKKMRNQYWNAFKHATTRSGQDREDQDLLSDFSDTINDHMLFIGWYDYMMAVKALPIEVQCFQLWYFAMYSSKINSEKSISDALNLFGRLYESTRVEAKRRLRIVVAEHMKVADIMSDALTDPRPLILRNATSN